MHLPTWLIFLSGVVVPTGTVLQWIVQTFGGATKRLFIKTERDAIIWAHYEKRALHQGHQKKSPVDCIDGSCAKIVK